MAHCVIVRASGRRLDQLRDEASRISDPDHRGGARRLNARAAHLPDGALKIVMRGEDEDQVAASQSKGAATRRALFPTFITPRAPRAPYRETPRLALAASHQGLSAHCGRHHLPEAVHPAWHGWLEYRDAPTSV
jgi:hypothetical protein